MTSIKLFANATECKDKYTLRSWFAIDTHTGFNIAYVPKEDVINKTILELDLIAYEYGLRAIKETRYITMFKFDETSIHFIYPEYQTLVTLLENVLEDKRFLKKHPKALFRKELREIIGCIKAEVAPYAEVYTSETGDVPPGNMEQLFDQFERLKVKEPYINYSTIKEK